MYVFNYCGQLIPKHILWKQNIYCLCRNITHTDRWPFYKGTTVTSTWRMVSRFLINFSTQAKLHLAIHIHKCASSMNILSPQNVLTQDFIGYMTSCICKTNLVNTSSTICTSIIHTIIYVNLASATSCAIRTSTEKDATCSIFGTVSSVHTWIRLTWTLQHLTFCPPSI